MSQKTLLVCMAVVLFGASLVSWSAPIPPAKNNEAAPRGEVLCNHPVLVLASDTVCHVVEEPRIRSIGGRSFIVGKTVKDNKYTKEISPGKAVWVPLDKVKEMIELPAE